MVPGAIRVGVVGKEPRPRTPLTELALALEDDATLVDEDVLEAALLVEVLEVLLVADAVEPEPPEEAPPEPPLQAASNALAKAQTNTLFALF